MSTSNDQHAQNLRLAVPTLSPAAEKTEASPFTIPRKAFDKTKLPPIAAVPGLALPYPKPNNPPTHARAPAVITSHQAVPHHLYCKTLPNQREASKSLPGSLSDRSAKMFAPDSNINNRLYVARSGLFHAPPNPVLLRLSSHPPSFPRSRPGSFQWGDHRPLPPLAPPFHARTPPPTDPPT